MTEYILEAEKSGKRFSRKWVVSDVTFKMEKGSAMAFLGPNGAGKTTTISMFLDLIRLDRGQMKVFGLDSSHNGVEIRRRTGYVPERPKMIGWMTVDQIMKFVAYYYPTWDWDYGKRLREEYSLDPGSKVRVLSRGEEAKLALLLALSHRPELLILDDATSGVDTLFRHEIMESLICHLHEKGTSVFFATHMIGEIEGLVETILFLNDGVVEGSAKVTDLKKEFRRIRLYSEKDTVVPELPAGVNSLISKNAPRGREWIIDNFSSVELSEVSSDCQVEVEDLSLEEIYLAIQKSRKE